MRIFADKCLNFRKRSCLNTQVYLVGNWIEVESASRPILWIFSSAKFSWHLQKVRVRCVRVSACPARVKSSPPRPSPHWQSDRQLTAAAASARQLSAARCLRPWKALCEVCLGYMKLNMFSWRNDDTFDLLECELFSQFIWQTFK